MPVAPTADPKFDPDKHEDPARRPGQSGAEDQPARPGIDVDRGHSRPGTFDERQIPVDGRIENEPDPMEADLPENDGAGAGAPRMTSDGTTQDAADQDDAKRLARGPEGTHPRERR
ncbi:hypothetical protein [Phreatobacter stygius]|uniref:Uncharacterized protein n=1 Tax=Phreatobacter stygius TaxID=1940610 RepID=A0A4D7BGF7_9HYPH|nr:hypothetical protein [Phreatobacter stygius]QCI68838.1 hypothetical protein E8M01_34175 [Phreatobacter stygius]